MPPELLSAAQVTLEGCSYKSIVCSIPRYLFCKVHRSAQTAYKYLPSDFYPIGVPNKQRSFEEIWGLNKFGPHLINCMNIKNTQCCYGVLGGYLLAKESTPKSL